MNQQASPLAICVFLAFVGFVIGLSFWLGRKAKSADGYFAAHGEIPWYINGLAFAGDYLSAASFLGICGMIAFYGYDGFLYSIGYLAGWLVALFVIAEPMRRLGKFTFADALDAKFNSRSIKLTAAISTLLVSVFYLIPQMVGAGVLVRPLLGLTHETGVIIVGVVVVLIVTTAGMVSTTWVQFLKGALLLLFCLLLSVMILQGGLKAHPESLVQVPVGEIPGKILPLSPPWDTKYVRAQLPDGRIQTWKLEKDGKALLCQVVSKSTGGSVVAINGLPKSKENSLYPVGTILALPDAQAATGALSPANYMATLQGSTVLTWRKEKDLLQDDCQVEHQIYYPKVTSGQNLMVPGGSPTFSSLQGDKFDWKKLDFLSLMLALFCGTASLPHILIRYYTVKSDACVRKSTVLGIAAIGFFYVLTLFLGFGAMSSGALDPSDTNLAAPLLARSFGEWPFALVSAIAFTTVLGTVSGLILASSGAIAHDLMTNFIKRPMDDAAKVKAGKIAAIVVGVIAMVLGILFKEVNVNFLVGWAFNVAASANLPVLIMILFWKGTTKQGVAASITVGLISSLGWILASEQAMKDLYHVPANHALVPFSQPAIVTIPLAFAVLIIVSLMTRKKA